MSRYIDADAFIEWLKMTRKMLTNDGEREVITGTKVSELVANFPTAEVAELKRGRWEKIYKQPHLMRCSVCGSTSVEVNYNYCPNCGAKMQGEADE